MKYSRVRGAVVVALCVAMAVPPPVWAHGKGQFPVKVPYRLDVDLTNAIQNLTANPNAVSNKVFMNFESPHVHPLDLSGNTLAAVQTADNRVEIFSVASGVPVHQKSIPVGYDPVSCRFNPFNTDELWVVNHVSDTISIVSLSAGRVVKTLQTGDEPADVVFATFSSPSTANVAVVSSSQTDTIEAYRVSNLQPFASKYLDGEDPRALAVNPTTNRVYAAIFESGNSTTLIRHLELLDSFGPAAQASTHPQNPYGGQNPPYNNGIPGSAWVTPHGSRDLNQWIDLGFVPPKMGIIVRRDGAGRWKDDNGADWTAWVSGPFQTLSGRPDPNVNGPWQLLDNDIAVLEGTNGMATPIYVTRQMNLCMAIGVNPVTGNVFMVGTDATNEVRFEPAITGTFTRVMVSVSGPLGAKIALNDMNEEHLAAAQGGDAYSSSSVPQSERNKSIGDPRGIAFSPDGKYAYVTGMGSNNLAVLDANGTGRGIAKRSVFGRTIGVGEGPTGITYDGPRKRLYVLNRFEGSISTVDVQTHGAEVELTRTSFFDPTPIDIRLGRPHFYNTHQNSGLGQIACASCHVDGRMDRLSWDLGDPIGEVKPVTANGLLLGGIPGVHNEFKPFGLNNAFFDDFHPMKGPMTTQTLQDIIGKEPHHWRGDRDGIEEFAGAFFGLQGGDQPLSGGKMAQFEKFLASLAFPPNPHRNIDNTLAGGPSFENQPGTSVPKNNPLMNMKNQFSSGRFSDEGGLGAGEQLPPGNAWAGFRLYANNFREDPPPGVPFRGLDAFAQCIECHTLPIGSGSTHFTTDSLQDGVLTNFQVIPPGPNGEAHLAMVSQDGTGQRHFKTPHLRNQIEKEGLFLSPGHVSRAGFGTVHDGSGAGVAEFLQSPVFSIINDQEHADVVAFVLSISGGFEELKPFFGGVGLPTNAIPGPPGAKGNDAHAGIGKQVTLLDAPQTGQINDQSDAIFGRILLMLTVADLGHIDIVAHGVKLGQERGWSYLSGTGGNAIFQSDRKDETITYGDLTQLAGPGTELTFTVVPEGMGNRFGLDRDTDGAFRMDEIESGTDPEYAGDNIWADASTGGIETGRPEHPFNTMAEAVVALKPKAGGIGTIHLLPSAFNETIKITKPMTIVADNGTASIGNL